MGCALNEVIKKRKHLSSKPTPLSLRVISILFYASEFFVFAALLPFLYLPLLFCYFVLFGFVSASFVFLLSFFLSPFFSVFFVPFCL